MKRLVITSIMILLGIVLKAQSDTLAMKSDTLVLQLESAETLLFEGNFDEPYNTNPSINFSFSKFYQSKTYRHTHLYPHTHNVAFGFANLAPRTLSNIGTTQGAELKLNSWELAFSLGSLSIPLSKKYRWLFFAGLGIGGMQYNAEPNSFFIRIDKKTVQIFEHNLPEFKHSMISCAYINIPLMFEWQKKISKRKLFYIQCGVEAHINFFMQSKAVVKSGSTRFNLKFGRGLNILPLAIDAKLGIGFHPVGIYVRYGLLDFFRKGRGAEVVPVVLGIAFDL
ncbi:MAG: hypothetical protein LBK03_08260 [Bacteroidales bacterium]|nr:hypothetical protein [Bacteroidales bacterium]